MNKLRLWYCGNKAAVKQALISAAIVIVCVALIGTAVWVFTGPLTGNTRVDWTMQAYLVSADGNVVETTEISIAGRIKDRTDKRDSLWLGFTMPDSFQYPLSAKGETENYNLDKDGHLPYYVCHEYFFNQHTASFFSAYYAIDTQKEYFIAYWDDGSGQCLVASTGEVDPQVILAHFQTFIDTLPKDN